MLLTVGQIGKPHGIRGEVSVSVRTDEPEERFAAGSVFTTEVPRDRRVNAGPAAAVPGVPYQVPSSLVVESVRWHQGRGIVQFDVVMHRERSDRHVRVRARVARRSRVRSSNGELSQRLFVETTLRLAGIEKSIEIGLVDRAKMIHRMLLGRAALAGPFLVDVDHRMLQSKRRRRARRS